jgi:hypothetical protein
VTININEDFCGSKGERERESKQFLSSKKEKKVREGRERERKKERKRERERKKNRGRKSSLQIWQAGAGLLFTHTVSRLKVHFFSFLLVLNNYEKNSFLCENLKKKQFVIRD